MLKYVNKYVKECSSVRFSKIYEILIGICESK